MIFQAIGICSGCARLFGLGCPFMGNLAVYWKPLPMVLLGAPTLAVAALMTKGLDSMAKSNWLKKHSKFQVIAQAI